MVYNQIDWIYFKVIIPISDILWADPVDNDTGYCENFYKPNEVRGCSYFYG